MFCANLSISSEFRDLFSLFFFFYLSLSLSVCVTSSLVLGFFPPFWSAGIAQLRDKYQSSHTLRGMEIIQKNDAFMQKFYGLFTGMCACVHVCVVKLAIRIEMERNGYNYCQILLLISYVNCKYMVYIYLEFWSFTIQQRMRFFLSFCFLEITLAIFSCFFFWFFSPNSKFDQLNYASFAIISSCVQDVT